MDDSFSAVMGAASKEIGRRWRSCEFGFGVSVCDVYIGG